jgi:excisionase family DNA binding protein
VAERLRVHPITVRRLIASGRLAAIRIGRAVRVREADVGDIGENQARLEAKRPYGWPLPDAERERMRKIVQDMRRERDSLPPLGISTDRLVREARKELEDRYRIPPGLDRRRVRRG